MLRVLALNRILQQCPLDPVTGGTVPPAVKTTKLLNTLLKAMAFKGKKYIYFMYLLPALTRGAELEEEKLTSSLHYSEMSHGCKLCQMKTEYQSIF